jgi:uncharacterized protein GlcG (DUF336 family)
MLKKLLLASGLAGSLISAAYADGGNGLLGQSSDSNDAPYGKASCSIPQSTLSKFQGYLNTVVGASDHNGGIFKPNMMWLSIVDRKGTLCLVIKSPGDPWPGSRDIAIAKANTANAFSNNKLALSTANLYTPTQPGGPLYGLNNSNPFNPTFNAQGTGLGFAAGGVITFGGGVALYQGGSVIGGLGVSGDSSCADHSIAYRVRAAAIAAGVLSSPVSGDNICYIGDSCPATSPGVPFTQPHCGATGDVTP